MNEQTAHRCRFHGCTRPATETVVTDWPCRNMTGEGTVLVTIQGWVEERCHTCAVDIVRWPPLPRTG